MVFFISITIGDETGVEYYNLNKKHIYNYFAELYRDLDEYNYFYVLSFKKIE